MIRCLLLFLSVFCLEDIYSQQTQSGVIDSIALKEGDHLLRLATFANRKNKRDSVIVYLQRAIPYYKASGNYKKYINTLLILSNQLRAEGRFNDYFANAQSTIILCDSLLGGNDPYCAQAINNLSTYYYDRGDYERSLELSKKSLRIFQSNEGSKSYLPVMIRNLALTLIQVGDYAEALTYQEQLVAIRENEQNKRPFRLIDAYNSIAWNYSLQEKPEKAFNYYDKSIQLLSKQKQKEKANELNTVIRTYQGVAEVAIQQEKYPLAIAYVEKALAYQEDDNAFRKPYSCELLGRVYRSQGQNAKALQQFRKAKDLEEQKKAKIKIPDLARKYLRIAEIYADLLQRDSSIHNYQRALQVLAPGFSALDPVKNPEGDSILSLPDALDILAGKGSILWEDYSTGKKNSERLLQSYQTFITGVEIIKILRQGVVSTAAKNTLTENTVPVYEGAIRAALEVYKISGDQESLANAFKLAESNKSLLLLESFNEQSALGLKDLPDSMLLKDKELRLQIAFYQRKLIEAGEDQTKASQIKEWKDQLFKNKQAIGQLTDDFENKYPRFYRLKYADNNPEISDWQAFLDRRDQALIEYFVGEDNIYGFVLWANGLQVFQIDDREKIFSAIQQLTGSIEQVPEDAEVLQNYQQFTSAAHLLYERILAPALDLLPDHIHSLKIVPDDRFNYIPFDLLLTEKAREGQPYFSTDQLEYVLEKYTVSYDYSATWMLKNKNEGVRKFQGNLIAFAPSFKKASGQSTSRSCRADELYQLECSTDEVQGINKLLGGELRIGNAAQTTDFEQEAAGYRIIHLATHACADESNPLFNKIFLTDDYLSNADLYNTRLNAELVVLSACNTGSGKLVKGEGVLSLARGFVQAGCASSVVSRWSVDDCATSDIMRIFYQELKAGKEKHEALRLAKLGYLKTADQFYAHPYYWSAFVAYGDMGAMELEGRSWWFYLLGILLVIALAYILSDRYKTVKTPA